MAAGLEGLPLTSWVGCHATGRSITGVWIYASGPSIRTLKPCKLETTSAKGFMIVRPTMTVLLTPYVSPLTRSLGWSAWHSSVFTYLIGV